MIKRRRQILEWLAENVKAWPGPFDTNPDCADICDIGAEWVLEPAISTLPVARCRLGGTGYITSVDWFYFKKGKK